VPPTPFQNMLPTPTTAVQPRSTTILNNIIDLPRADNQSIPRHDISVFPLSLDNSVIVDPRMSYCLPQSYRFIRFRIRFGYTFRSLQLQLNAIVVP
jgi:hypothetical protein